MIRQSLRYLRWILLHKLYVFAGGLAIMTTVGSVYERPWRYRLAFLWRLLRHDLSKLLPSEFFPYRVMFYPTETPTEWIEAKAHVIGAVQANIAGVPGTTGPRQLAEAAWGKEKSTRKAAYDRAWLKHIHRNDHHWQHWLLQQDDGRKIALLPPTLAVDEMVADWLGAGSKINELPTLAECVGMTIAWYAANRRVMELRAPVRERVEETLLLLGRRYGLADLVVEMMEQREVTRDSQVKVPAGTVLPRDAHKFATPPRR